MKVVATVANWSSYDRAVSFISSIKRTVNVVDIIFINTGKPHFGMIDRIRGIIGTGKHSLNVIELNIPHAVSPVQQIKYRIDAAKEICDDDTIYFNFDDDYVFNPHWRCVANDVMMENQHVHYITLIKLIPQTGLVAADYIKDKVKICGFNFARVKSALGGSFGARWKFFKHHIEEFIASVDERNSFDVDFWKFARKYFNSPYYIYMLNDFSLYQHCNLVSQYGHHWPHTYGDSFDPVVNPYKVPIQ